LVLNGYADTLFLQTPTLAASKAAQTGIVCRLPIIGKNRRRMKPIWGPYGNFCRL
jgi:hypothetical protein